MDRRLQQKSEVGGQRSAGRLNGDSSDLRPLTSDLCVDFSDFGFYRTDDDWLASLRHADDAPSMGKFGEYELIGEVGRGGQGVVYEALQPGTNRRIALKRLWAGSLASASMRARFEREVEAVSLLNHPNIVRIHASESIDGQQTLAMEWIEGVPIDQWAAEPGPTEQLLRIFTLVCDAVCHAHQRGVLHRDLKPSNILVDENDQPHVLDFGLAKFKTDEVLPGGEHLTLTHASGFLGTPAYASPEQVSGSPADVDLRSDVYSLGVILYQMLTGQLPHGGARSLAEIFDAIRRDDPRKPSALRRDLDAEVDAIVLKALEKDPQRRYQSVDALGADVRRYLNHETVLAHPANAVYQARKFVARHRVMAISALAVILTLALGLAGTLTALVQLRASQSETQSANESAEQINAFLNQMLSTADPAVIRGYDAPVSAMLDEAVKKLDAGALSGQPDAESKVRCTIAQAYQSLGLFPPARTQFQAALDRHQSAHPVDDLESADLMLKLAQVLYTDEEFDQSGALTDRALEIRRRLLGVDHPDTCRAELSQTTLWSRMGESGRARAALCDLLPRVIRITGGEVNDLVIAVKISLGYAGGCNGDWEQAIALYQEALAAQRQLYGADDDRIARTMVNMGANLSDHGQREQALPLLREALDMRLRLYGDDHPATASAMYNLANAVFPDDRAEGEQLYRRALDIKERRLSPGHFRTARTRTVLGGALTAMGQYEEAEQQLRRAIKELADKPPGLAARTVNARRALATCMIKQNRFDEAQAILTEAWNDATTRFAAYNRAASVINAHIALYNAWGKPELAEQWKAKKAQQAQDDQP